MLSMPMEVLDKILGNVTDFKDRLTLRRVCRVIEKRAVYLMQETITKLIIRVKIDAPNEKMSIQVNGSGDYQIPYDQVRQVWKALEFLSGKTRKVTDISISVALHDDWFWEKSRSDGVYAPPDLSIITPLMTILEAKGGENEWKVRRLTWKQLFVWYPVDRRALNYVPVAFQQLIGAFSATIEELEMSGIAAPIIASHVAVASNTAALSFCKSVFRV